MFTKFLVIYIAVAILGIATESFADTVEIIEIDPEQFNHPNPNSAQCQQLMRFYSDYYKNAYSKLYKEAYSKYYDEYYSNYYKQQNANQRQGPDVILDNAQVEWVCTNPKTKDKFIIGSQQSPVNNNGNHYQPSPHYPPHNGGHYHPSGPYYPPPERYPSIYPPTDFYPNHPNYKPPQNPHHNHPDNLPQNPNHNHSGNPSQNPNNNYPENPQQTPNGSSNQQSHGPENPKTEEPNTNGEGIIDIRFGEE